MLANINLHLPCTFAIKLINQISDESVAELLKEVNNIDKEAPNGSCSGYTKAGKSYIKINSNDKLYLLS